MKRHVLYLLILCFSIFILTTSCADQSAPIDLSIGLTYAIPDALINSDDQNAQSSYMQEREGSASSQQDRINEYLKETGRNYRVKFEILFSSDSSSNDLSPYDLIYSASKYTPTELNDAFIDLSDELTNGRLQTLYHSLPETYWQTLSVNGHIYNTVRHFSNVTHGLRIQTTNLNKLGLTAPDSLIGQPLQDWKPFFEEIYQANHKQGFIMPPFYSTSHSLLLSGYVWDAHFQLITPYIGISYEHPEDGVQFLYDTEFAKQMQQVWMEFLDAGYLLGDSPNADDPNQSILSSYIVSNAAFYDTIP